MLFHQAHVLLKVSFKHFFSTFHRFEGVSWSQDESFIAYVAEEPANTRPVYGQSVSSCAGQSSSDSLESGSWRGQGDWLEDWGESYSGKRRPVLFVVNIARYCIVQLYLRILDAKKYGKLSNLLDFHRLMIDNKLYYQSSGDFACKAFRPKRFSH
jgi:hypothetical protein